MIPPLLSGRGSGLCAAAAPVILPAVFWRIAKLPLTATPFKDLAYVSLGLPIPPAQQSATS